MTDKLLSSKCKRCSLSATRHLGPTGRITLCETHFREWLNERCKYMMFRSYSYEQCEFRGVELVDGKKYCRMHAKTVRR